MFREGKQFTWGGKGGQQMKGRINHMQCADLVGNPHSNNTTGKDIFETIRETRTWC